MFTKFFMDQFFPDQNILTGHFFSWQKFFLPKLFGTKIFFAKFLWLFGWHFFWRQNFLEKILCYQNQFGPKIFLMKFFINNFYDETFFVPKFSGPKFLFWTKTKNLLRLKCQFFLLTGCPAKHVHFCFLNFSASKGSKTAILDIFQQRFLCRFKKNPFFIIWWILEWDIKKVLQGVHL